MKDNIVCIIQARTTSSRLPGKVFLDLEGRPVLEHIVLRLKESKLISKIVVVCPDNEDNNKIESFINKKFQDVGVFRGSEDDLLESYYMAAEKFKADAVVRITGDCPLIDSEVVDLVIKSYIEKQYDYCANILQKRTYPRGLDTEVFSFQALEKMREEGREREDREHVTIYLRKNPGLFKTFNITNDIDYSKYRLTIDTELDYQLIKKIYQKLYNKNNNFRLKDIISLFDKNTNLSKINKLVEQKNAEF